MNDPARRPRLGRAPDTQPVSLDITDSNAVATAVDAAVDWFGRIDVLVNNAGLDLPGADPGNASDSLLRCETR
jgi:NADP-dependent 3-hydroxy acid dehydrogenase YdfG